MNTSYRGVKDVTKYKMEECLEDILYLRTKRIGLNNQYESLFCSFWQERPIIGKNRSIRCDRYEYKPPLWIKIVILVPLLGRRKSQQNLCFHPAGPGNRESECYSISVRGLGSNLCLVLTLLTFEQSAFQNGARKEQDLEFWLARSHDQNKASWEKTP